MQVSCQVLIDGEIRPVQLDDDGVTPLSKADGLTATYHGLPTGARCTVAGTGSASADAVAIDPGEVTVGDGTVGDVLVVNTFDPTPPPPEPPGGHLPNTGGPSIVLMLLTVLLLVGGGGAMVLARRRSKR